MKVKWLQGKAPPSVLLGQEADLGYLLLSVAPKGSESSRIKDKYPLSLLFVVRRSSLYISNCLEPVKVLLRSSDGIPPAPPPGEIFRLSGKRSNYFRLRVFHTDKVPFFLPLKCPTTVPSMLNLFSLSCICSQPFLFPPSIAPPHRVPHLVSVSTEFDFLVRIFVRRVNCPV